MRSVSSLTFVGLAIMTSAACSCRIAVLLPYRIEQAPVLEGVRVCGRMAIATSSSFKTAPLHEPDRNLLGYLSTRLPPRLRHRSWRYHFVKRFKVLIVGKSSGQRRSISDRWIIRFKAPARQPTKAIASDSPVFALSHRIVVVGDSVVSQHRQYGAWCRGNSTVVYAGRAKPPPRWRFISNGDCAIMNKGFLPTDDGLREVAISRVHARLGQAAGGACI